MMKFVELPLSEWRRIAYRSDNEPLLDYIRQFHETDGNEMHALHPVEHEYDTGKLPAVQVDEEARIEAKRAHWEDRKAIERDLPVRYG
jgi:hypothetical protein